MTEFEEDDIVDDRLTAGAMIQIYSTNDPSLTVKATVETVDWELHKITISFANAAAGERLLATGHVSFLVYMAILKTFFSDVILVWHLRGNFIDP